jgi:two-component system nitrate/nitrite response regulator NarL
MTISVAVIRDNSIAMGGAIRCVDESNLLSSAGVYETPRQFAERTTVRACVVLIDPFTPLHRQADLGSLPRACSILMMSDCTDAGLVRSALTAGARGFVSKTADLATLVNAISAVGHGGIYLGKPLDRLLLDQPGDPVPAQPAVENLTARERDVLVMIAQGMTHKQIGTRLNLSKATVDTYVYRLRQKLGGGNKAQLTRRAIDLHLLPAV